MKNGFVELTGYDPTSPNHDLAGSDGVPLDIIYNYDGEPDPNQPGGRR